jgi:endogenous inhibitor of DNA gyrase (YacG/DUF329 family)
MCVQCRKRPADPRHAPFCSERCRLVDLGAWLDGRYRVAIDGPSPQDDVPDDEASDAEDEG